MNCDEWSEKSNERDTLAHYLYSMLEISFNNFPSLYTERLYLREINNEDVQALYILRNDEDVMRYIGRPKPQNMEEVTSMIEKIRTDFRNNDGISWIIELKETKVPIGTIGFWRMDKTNHRAEIGYMLNKEHWGKGYATEALHAVIPYAFQQLNFHSIEANVDPLNNASIKLLQKSGFSQEAYFRENFYFNGQFLDSMIFSLLKNEFKAL